MQEPDIFAAAKAAVAADEVEQTNRAGGGLTKSDFRDVPRDGAILIGFDLALGKQFDEQVIHALRPVYRTDKGEAPGPTTAVFPPRSCAPRQPTRPSRYEPSRAMPLAR